MNSDVKNDIVNNNTILSNEEDKFELVETILYCPLIIIIIIMTSSYTIIMIYSTNRRTYISRDYLSGKKMNDTISQMKTLKSYCFLFLLFYMYIGLQIIILK